MARPKHWRVRTKAGDKEVLCQKKDCSQIRKKGRLYCKGHSAEWDKERDLRLQSTSKPRWYRKQNSN